MVTHHRNERTNNSWPTVDPPAERQDQPSGWNWLDRPMSPLFGFTAASRKWQRLFSLLWSLALAPVGVREQWPDAELLCIDLPLLGGSLQCINHCINDLIQGGVEEESSMLYLGRPDISMGSKPKFVWCWHFGLTGWLGSLLLSIHCGAVPQQSRA